MKNNLSKKPKPSRLFLLSDIIDLCGANMKKWNWKKIKKELRGYKNPYGEPIKKI